MKKILIIILLLIVFSFGGYYLWSNYPTEEPKKIIVLFGENFDSNIESLDVSEYDVENNTEWINSLKEFDSLKEVTFGNKTISIDTKNSLIKRYPNISFKVVAMVNLYGLELKENITSVDLNGVSIDKELINKLANFPDLMEVDLSDKKLDKNEQLQLVKKYPNIYFKWKVNILKEEVLSDVTKLDFSKKTIDDYEDFSNTLALLPKLKDLDMSNTNLSNEELGHLRELYPNVNIDWIIHFGVWSTKTDVVSFSTLVGGFHYVRLTDEDIKVLKYCNRLQALDLGHQAVTDLGFIVDSFPELRVLIMADNKTLSDLKPLTKLKHLHYLEIFLDAVTDVTPLTELSELVDLNLSYNRSLTDISPLIEKPLPMLERLWVPGCPISEKDLEKLITAYPDAKIVTKSSGSTGNGWRSGEKYTEMITMFRKQSYISDIFLAYDK